MTSWLIRALDAYVARDSLLSQCRMLGVPHWPWDSNAKLRRKLDWATMTFEQFQARIAADVTDADVDRFLPPSLRRYKGEK